MTDTLAFDEREAEQEEAIYETAAATDRRRLVRRLLDVVPGETVLSIGCGPGFEPAELAAVVGANGHVHGVDRSEAMLARAARRCRTLPEVTLARGDARSLPVAAGSFDAALAVQVYEYVPDVETALAELRRVLRPRGRAAVYDTDFDSLVWRSQNPERMERVLDAFGDHCPRPHLGSELEPRLRDADLTVERAVPNTILDTRFDRDSFSRRLARSVEEYAAAHEAIGPAEAAAWAEDLRDPDAAGGSFFSLTQYCYLVRKPD